MSEPEYLYLDRFEDGVAVLVAGDLQFNLPAGLLPAGTREGDYLELRLSLAPERRSGAAREISDLRKRLSSRDQEHE